MRQEKQKLTWVAIMIIVGASILFIPMPFAVPAMAFSAYATYRAIVKL